MNIGRKTPTNDEIAESIYNLATTINTNYAILSSSNDAILAVMCTKFPDFQELYDRADYMNRCMALFSAEGRLKDSGPFALEMLNEYAKSVAALKAEGKEKGWQGAFIKAKQEVAKLAREEDEEDRKAKLEIVES